MMTAHSKNKAGPITLACGLILGGAVLLLYNLGVIPSLAWLWKLSPILLVGIGLEYFLKRMLNRDPETEVRFSGASLMLIILLLLVGGVYSTAVGIAGSNFLDSLLWSWNGQTYVRTLETKPLVVQDGDKLVVDDPVGRIDLTPSSDNQLAVRALIRSPEGGPAREQADRASVEVTRSGNQIFVRVPASSLNSISYDLEIKVPPKLDASITSITGAVFASDLQGGLEIRANTGKVDLKRIGGNVSVINDTGLIRILEPGGDVTAKTRSGSLDCSARRPLAGKYDLKANTGKIRFSLPVASDLAIRASSDAGRISVSGFGGNKTDRDGVGGSFDGKLGSGKGQALLQVDTGSIVITASSDELGDGAEQADLGVETGPDAGSAEINAQ